VVLSTKGLLAGFSSSAKPSETALGEVADNMCETASGEVETSSSDDDEPDICFQLMRFKCYVIYVFGCRFDLCFGFCGTHWLGCDRIYATRGNQSIRSQHP
jgi:hypothetical protein